MPSFNPKQVAYRVRNANNVTVMIGDQIVGFAQTTQHSFDFGTQGLYGIGTALPQEIQQLRVSPQITIDALALTDSGKQVLGETATISSILANNEFNLHVVDGAGNSLYTYVGCVASNFSESIPQNQPISDTLVFMALDVLDDSGQSILNVGSAYQIPGGNASAAGAGLGFGG